MCRTRCDTLKKYGDVKNKRTGTIALLSQVFNINATLLHNYRQITNKIIRLKIILKFFTQFI